MHSIRILTADYCKNLFPNALGILNIVFYCDISGVRHCLFSGPSNARLNIPSGLSIFALLTDVLSRNSKYLQGNIMKQNFYLVSCIKLIVQSVSLETI